MGLYTSFVLVAHLFTGNPSWIDSPNILICESSRVTVKRTTEAVKFWQELGHSFGGISKALPDNMYCVKGEPPYGTIMIDIPSQDFKFGNHLGSTKTWWKTERNAKAKGYLIKKKGDRYYSFEKRFKQIDVGGRPSNVDVNQFINVTPGG